jgi:hypothetical protein
MNFTFTLSPRTNRAGLDAKLDGCDPRFLWDVKVTERKSRRSTEQNSRLWALYNALGQHIGIEADEVHQLMGFKFLRYQKYVGDKIEEFIKSTTKLNTAEMTEYQENIERWAEQAGFYFDES